MNARTRRGQPLIALAMLLSGWVMVRAAIWDWPIAAQTDMRTPERAAAASVPPVRAQTPDSGLGDQARAAPALQWPDRDFAGQPFAGSVEPDRPAGSRPMPVMPASAQPPQLTPYPPRIAAGHQMLWLAGVSQLPLPPEIVAHLALRQPPAPLAAAPSRSTRLISRWSGDGWLLLRRGGNGFNLPGAGLPGANLPSGAYGASQAGAVIRYRLAAASPLRPALYLRASSGLERPRGEEAALGLSIRPLPRVPVAAMAEVRVTRTLSGEVVRPAVALVSELPPASLPLGLRAEVYAQAGWVGGKGSSAFVDGQARVERPLLSAGRIELRAGAGGWGGAQEGARRLDLGPTVTLAVPLGPVGGRVSADWRFRVAGEAAPGSGPALTLSAGF